ncbi:hypothetical protein P7C71_g6293, partial [Lecanoromycetidae sp. Uapishka_2]
MFLTHTIHALLFYTLTKLTAASPLTPRDTTSLGLQVALNQTSTCSPSALTALQTAIDDARSLSTSALTALNNPTQNPASYFFPSNYASTATSVFNAVLLATEQMATGKGTTDPKTELNPILLYCQDLDNMCDTKAPGNDNLNTKDTTTSNTLYGYVPEDANPAPGFGTAQIVICPALLTLPENPPPCTGTAGEATIGWAFLRTLLQLRSVQFGYSKAAKDAIFDYAPGVQQSHGLLKTSMYGQNVDSFAELATLSYDLGVTGSSMGCSEDYEFV